MTFDVIDNAGNYVTVNGTLNEGCVLGFPLTQTATGVDPVYGNAVVQATYSDGSLNETDPEITKFTFSADQTINCVTGVTLTVAQAAESGMVLSGTNKTLTLKCALPQASCCAKVCGSLGLTLNATAASNVQSFNMRTNTTTGALTVTKGVFEIGEGASFPNVSGVSIGAEGELRVTTAVADPIPTTTVLDLPIGAKISVASGASVTVDSAYLNGVQQSAQMLRDAGVVTGAGTFTVSHGPIVISEDTTLTTLPADAHYMSSNGATLTLNLTEDVVFAGSFGGNLKVVKADATTLTLEGVNVMPAFTVSAGTLVLANEQALSESATLTVADGAAVRLDEAMAGRTATVGTLHATGNILLWATNETTLVVNTLTCSGSAYATVNDRDTDVKNGTVTIGTTAGFAGGTIEACSGTLEMSDLSYIQNPTNLITGYGTLYYKGPSTTKGLALKIDKKNNTSVIKIDNDWTISCLTNLNVTSNYGGILKIGSGNLTVVGTDRVKLASYDGGGNTGPETKIASNGDCPTNRIDPLDAGEGLLTIGVKDDAQHAPFIDCCNRTIAVRPPASAKLGDATLSFDNGIVTNCGTIFVGHRASSNPPQTATVRWRGGKTYASELKGNVANTENSPYRGNADFLMEAGEAVFKDKLYLSYSTNTYSKIGESDSRCRLLVTGGRFCGQDHLYLGLSTNGVAPDCLVAVGPGELTVKNLILSRYTGTEAVVWANPDGLISYEVIETPQLTATNSLGISEGTVLYGNGGVFNPRLNSNANALATLEHLYASTNGFVFSAGTTDSNWYTIVKGLETEPGLAQDGGFEVRAGQVRLAAASTFNGPLKVTGGTLALGTTETTAASFANVTSIQVADGAQLNVEATVPFATDVALTLVTGAVVDIADGETLTVGTATLNGESMTAADLRTAGVVTGTGTLVVLNEPGASEIVISEDTTLTTLRTGATYTSSNGSTLTLDLASDTTFDGAFAGNLKVRKIGAGVLTLNGSTPSSASEFYVDNGSMTLETLNATGNIILWTTNGTTLVVNTLTGSGSATVNDRDTDVMNGTVKIGTTTGFTGTIEACSGTLEMSDLSFVEEASDLVLGYGTLHYTGAAATIPGLALQTGLTNRTSVVRVDTALTVTNVTNLSTDNCSGLLKLGTGTLTVGGTERVVLVSRQTTTTGSLAENGDSPSGAVFPIASADGTLAFGVTGDAEQAPIVDLGGQHVAAGPSYAEGDSTLSFDNGVVTNAGVLYAGYYGSDSADPKTVTIRWRGGKTYATDMTGNYGAGSTSYAGDVNLVMEDGEAYFSNQISLSLGRAAAGVRSRLLITGGQMVADGDLYLARSDTYTGADCSVSVGPGTLSVRDIILHRITKGAAGVTAPLTELWVHTGGTLKYRDIKEISTAGIEGGSIYGNGGVWMPISDTKTKDSNEFGSLEHVYASTNGFKFSTAISGAGWYTIVKGIETEPGLAQDGGFEVMRGQVRLAAACTFNGPLKVTGGTLALGTNKTEAASFVNVTSLQVADGARLNVETTVPFATDVVLTLVTGSVVDIADGETLTVGTATLNGTAMTAADLRTAGVVTGTGTLVVLNEPTVVPVTEDTTLTELAPGARYSSSNGSKLTVDLASDTAFGGTFGGNLKLVKTGTGNLTLTSASTIDTIAVSNGTLTAAGGATSVLPGTAILTVTRGATVNIAEGSTLAVARIVVDGIRLNERQLRARGHVTGTGTLQLDPIPYLIINEDNDHFFKTKEHEMSAAACDEYADSMTTGGVTHVFWTCCGQCPSFCPTNTATAWDPIWTDTITSQWAANAKALHDQGVDPYERWLARCRQNGVVGFISMRMNDHHHTNVTNHFRTTSFWRTNQENYVEAWIPNAKGESPGYHHLDYAKKVVWDYHMAMVDEILSRWDLDGIELDFMRSPVYFKTNAMDIVEKAYRGIVSPENAALMTEFVGEVRRKADLRAAQLGHPVQVAVRVPRLLQGSAGSNNVSRGCRSSGLYVDDWAQSNYVDMVIFSGSQQDWTYDLLPSDTWQEQIDAHPNVVYLPGMDDGVQSITTYLLADLPIYRAYASDMYDAGAKGLYLFNLIYLDDWNITTTMVVDGREGQQLPIYHHGALDPENLGAGMARRYVAKRILSSKPKEYKAKLPATLPAFNAASVTVCFNAPQTLADLEIYLNGHRVDQQADMGPYSVSEPHVYADEDGKVQYAYVWDVPNEWVVSGQNELAVTNFVSANTICELALDMPHESTLYGDSLWKANPSNDHWQDAANWENGIIGHGAGRTAYFPEESSSTTISFGADGEKDPIISHLVISNADYAIRKASGAGEDHVFTFSDHSKCSITVLGADKTLELSTPVYDRYAPVKINTFDLDTVYAANRFTCGRVIWDVPSFTGSFELGLCLGAGRLDFPTASSLAFLTDPSMLVIDGQGTVRYTGDTDVSIAGFTLDNTKYNGANSFAVSNANVTVTVNQINSPAGLSKASLYKSGLGTMRIAGTAESVIGGGQIYGLATNNEQLVGITANGSVWTNRVQNLTVAEGTFVVGTVNDPSDAPIVTVPCTAAIGSYGIANDAELVLNNGSLTVTNDSLYVGYWSLGTNKTNRLTLNGGCLTVANGSLNLLLGSSYSDVSFRDASSAEVVINGGELNVSKAVSIGCTRSKSTDSRIAITMNDGLWTVGSSMRFGYVYSQTITTFTGNGGRLEIAGMLDTSYKNTDSSRPCTLDFNSGFVLKVPTIAATKPSGPTTVTFNGGAWEQPLGKNALIASNKVVTVGANGWTIVTTNVLDGASGATVLTVDQAIAGTGDITVAGNGRFAFGESFTNSTWTGALVLARPDAAALEVPADVTVTVDELRVPAGTTAVCVQDGTVYVRALYVGGVRSFTMPCSGTGTLIIDNSAIDITTDTTLTELQPGATYTSSNGSTLTLDLASDTTFDGVFTGKLKLAKAGAGTLTLTGASTIADVTVSAGTLALGTGGSLDALRVLNFSAGATLDLAAGVTLAVDRAYVDGTLVTRADLAAAGVTVSGEGTLTVANQINFRNPDGTPFLYYVGSKAQHVQGVTFDGTNLYATYSTLIVKADLYGTVLATNVVHEHLGDPSFAEGALCIPQNYSGNFNGSGTPDNRILVYADGDILSTPASYAIGNGPDPLTGPAYGAGGMTYKDGFFYVIGGLPDGAPQNYVYKYSFDATRTGDEFHLEAVTTIPIFTGKGIQTAAALSDGRLWFGTDTANDTTAYPKSIYPVATLVCNEDTSDFHRISLRGPWGIFEHGGYVGVVLYTGFAENGSVTIDFNDGVSVANVFDNYRVGYTSGRVDVETIENANRTVGTLAVASTLGSGKTVTATVEVVSRTLTVTNVATLGGAYVGQLGRLVLDGGTVAFSNADGGTLLTVGAETATDRRGEILGNGTFTATAANAAIAVYDRVIADGGDLDLRAFASVTEATVPNATKAGWYAQNGGRVLVPTTGAASALQNAVTSAQTGLRTAVLASDHASCPSLSGYEAFAVWNVEHDDTTLEPALTFVHDFSEDPIGDKTVYLLKYESGAWTQVATLDPTQSSVAATGLGYFAVAVEGPTVIDITTDTTLTELQPGATYTSSNGSTLTLNLASATTFDGAFTGDLKLAKTGAGTLTLTGANTATNITVASGTLTLGSGGSLSTDTVLYLASGAVFDLPSGVAQTVSAAYLNLAWKSASALRTLETVTGEGTLTVTNEPTAPTPAPVPTADVIVLSHRGGRSENTSIPENTVEKFQASAAAGNKAFETDVKMTADGELVISHSSLLGNYITGAEGQIEYTNVVEVTNRTIKSTACRIPTLDQLLTVFAAVEDLQRVEFEMKVRTASGETGTLEFYRGENLTNYCNRLYAKVSAALPAGTYAFTSFDATTLQVMKALHPEASTGYIESNVISDNFITKAITYGCDSLSPKYPTSASDAATTATKIAAAQARDLRVGLWMVDSYVTFTNSAAMGAYEITSDCPTTVRDEPVPPPGPEPEPTDVTTIALWPIEFGAETIGLASVGTVTTPLTQGTRVTSTVQASAAGIPAAYDFDPTLAGVDITNRTTYAKNTKVKGNSYHFTVGDDFGSTYCSHTNDAFTIEGFFSLSVLPASGQWAMFVGSQYRTDVDNNFRWHVSLAPDANGFRFGYKPCWATDNTSVFTPYLDDAQMLQLTNDWNHFAITYKRDDGSGLAWLRFYLNGTLLLDDHRAAKTPAAEEVSPRGNLDFGGISYSGSYCAAGAYDYIRVADVALDPSRFLTATRYQDETSATIAYWKLDWTDEDLLNMHPSVGTRQLNGLIPGAASTDAIPSANADFINDDDAGTPSNLQMTPAATGSTANKGCLWLHGAAANVKQTGIASELSLTNAFTIEGWVRPFADSANTPQTLLTTDHATSGWTLSLASSGGNWFFKVYAGDGGTPLLGSGGTVVSAALTDVNSWRHIALAYDPTVGKGTWTFYIDGVQSGTAENSATPVNGSASTVLMFGITHNYGYRGYIDYVRVCRTALAPSQFLNAASGTAATDVLALWPLDVLDGDGARFDGRDAAAGTYPLAWIRTGNAYKVSKEASAPVITNPDRTPGFVGDPSEVESATEFFKSSSVGNRSYLMSMDANVLALLNSTSPYTIECFAKRNSVSITDTETYLFGSYCSVKGDGVTVSSLLGYKLANNGFFMHDRIWQGSDSGVSSTFPQASAIEDGAWHHVAWQREFVDASTARYTLWVDGQCKGTADEATTSLGKYKATAFFVGGRPETSNAKKNQQWRGAISSVRVSNRILAASEFLNAAPEKPLPEDAATTIAYWPLENRAGLPVMQSIVNARGASLTGADVAGSDAQAFIVCPNPDRSGAAFTADPNVNTGSVSVTAASVLTNGTLASSVALEQTFTIEGWIRRALVGEAAETIVGTLDASGAGWRLYFDGTALKLMAKTGTSLPVLHEGATLVADVSGWTGRWTHLALERLSSAGQWKLFVDGIETVTLTDGWQGATGSGAALAFGGFTGELDMWRLSRGALTSELLLYADYLALDDTAGRLQVVLPAEYVDQFPGADKAEKLVAASNALLTVEANGNKSWLNYALGQDADTEVSIEVDQTATDKVGQRTSFSVPINKTGFRVTYEKIVRTASGTVTNAVKDAETGFDIPLTGTDPTGVYQVRTLVENTAQKDGPLSTDVLMEKVGVMRVAATGLQTNAIVAVPWEQLGAQTAVTVDKLIDVPASALADGDQLRVYDATGSYVFWYLDGGVWTSGTTVGSGGSVTAPAASETMVKRGDGVWLVRMKSAVANVYLVGRSSDTAAVTTLASGYNLVASPDLTGLDINVKFPGDTGKDQIRVPGAEPLNCQKRGGTWGCLRYVDGSWKWTAITEPLAVGTGFFYINDGASKDVTW